MIKKEKEAFTYTCYRPEAYGYGQVRAEPITCVGYRETYKIEPDPLPSWYWDKLGKLGKRDVLEEITKKAEK